MLASEVVNEIQNLMWTHGDLEVFCTSDHGQDYESVFGVFVSHYKDEDGEIYPVHPTDLEEYLENLEPGEFSEKAIFIN